MMRTHISEGTIAIKHFNELPNDKFFSIHVRFILIYGKSTAKK